MKAKLFPCLHPLHRAGVKHRWRENTPTKQTQTSVALLQHHYQGASEMRFILWFTLIFVDDTRARLTGQSIESFCVFVNHLIVHS